MGNKPTTALLMSPLTMTYCFAGGTFTDCVWARVSMAASGAHTNTLTDIAGFTFVRDTIRANTIRGNSTTYSLNATRANNCTWTNPTIIQGQMNFTTCADVSVTDTVYCENVSGTTPTTYTGSVWAVTSSCVRCTFSGLTFPVTNCHPYTSLLSAVACAFIQAAQHRFKAVRLAMGSANACGLIYSLATACSDVKVQRVYVTNTRTNTMTGDNSCSKVTGMYLATMPMRRLRPCSTLNEKHVVVHLVLPRRRPFMERIGLITLPLPLQVDWPSS